VSLLPDHLSSPLQLTEQWDKNHAHWSTLPDAQEIGIKDQRYNKKRSRISSAPFHEFPYSL
jgi:hypothetical protein